MAVNKVVYGNDTLIDLTGDTVTPATMLNGTTAHDASGKPITGSYVPPATPTDITPSNSNPVSLTANTPVKPTASGYAIASYTNIFPSNITPKSLKGKGIYRIDQGSAMSIEGYAISDYETITPSTTNRSYNQSSVNTFKKIDTRTGYIYGAIPTGRNLFSYTAQPNRDSTSWYTVAFSSASSTVYDADGTSNTVMLDENFAHFADGGEIVVDRACTIYIAGCAWYGRTSSGTAVYSGLRVLKNGSVISGTSITGASGSTSPSFRRIEVDVAVGDVLKIQTKVSSTSSANSKITVNICTD